MRIQALTLFLLLTACSTPPEVGEDDSTPITRATTTPRFVPVHRGEDAQTPLAVAWDQAPRTARAQTSLTLVVTSASASPITASLALVMSGLDDRSAVRRLSSVTVAPGASTRVTVSLASLDLRSTTHSVQLMAVATFTHDGAPMSVQSEPLAYHFDRAFAQASVYALDEMVTAFNGGVVDDSRPMEARVGSRDLGAIIEEEANARVQTARAQGRDLDASSALNLRTVATPQILFSPAPTPTASSKGTGGLGTGGNFPPPSCYPNPWDCCSGANCVNVCADWQTAYVDLTSAEDYLTSSNGTQRVDASYARFEIEQMPTCNGGLCSTIGTKVADGFLSPTGCIKVDLAANKNHRISVYTEFERSGVSAKVDYYTANNYASLVGVTKFMKTFTVVDKTVQSTYANLLSYHAAANAAAALSRALTIIKPEGSITVRAGVGCNGGVAAGGIPATDACAGDSSLDTGPNVRPDGSPGMLRWKFVLTHELGHVFQLRAHAFPTAQYCFNSGYNPEDAPCTYADPPQATNALCRCDHVTTANKLHCMQSLETDATAQVEGFAQFFSARAWNNPAGTDCSFNYYKQFNVYFIFGTAIAQPPVNLDCRERVQWRDAFCFNQGMSTEYDWMNFLWNVNTVGPNTTTISELFDIWNLALVSNVSPTWTQLRTAAASYLGSGSAKYAKFISDGDRFGVDADRY